MKNMKTAFTSSTKEITHPAMQCHTPEDRNPEQHACYTPDVCKSNENNSGAFKYSEYKKTALYWHTETAVSATRCLQSGE
jgi:hypothetical protein